MPPARRTIEAGGRPLIPGALDVHTHVREPGFSHKETWTTATAAAAVGGVTTIFDMPNTNPPTANAAAVRDKIAIAAPQAHVDFGVYGYVGEANLADLQPMAQAGASAFKLFLGSDNPLVPCPNDGAVLDALTLIRETGLRCTVHAENTPILNWRGAQMKAAGRDDLAAHLAQHADIATVEAVQRIALFAEWTGCKIHIAHENCRHALPVIAAAKRRGVDITAENLPALSAAEHGRCGACRWQCAARQAAGARGRPCRGTLGRPSRQHDRHDLDRPRAASRLRKSTAPRSGRPPRDSPASRPRCA